MPEEKAKNENIEQKDVKDLDKELSEFMPGASPKKAQTKQAGTQPKATKKRAVSKRPAAVRDKVISKGKRKRAIARVSITSGRGTILINGSAYCLRLSAYAASEDVYLYIRGLGYAAC